jgi:hypothetical protein
MPVVHATCFAAMLHHQPCHRFSHILVISNFKSLVSIFRFFLCLFRCNSDGRSFSHSSLTKAEGAQHVYHYPNGLLLRPYLSTRH